MQGRGGMYLPRREDTLSDGAYTTSGTDFSKAWLLRQDVWFPYQEARFRTALDEDFQRRPFWDCNPSCSGVKIGSGGVVFFVDAAAEGGRRVWP